MAEVRGRGVTEEGREREEGREEVTKGGKKGGRKRDYLHLAAESLLAGERTSVDRHQTLISAQKDPPHFPCS